MMHTKIEGYWPFGSGKKIFLGFYHIWTWRPSWLYDQDHLSKLLNYLKCWLFAVLLSKNHLIKYYDTCYESDGINRFWSIKNSNKK